MILNEIISAIETIPGIDVVIKAFGIVAVIIIVYIGFLLIKGFCHIRTLNHISKINKNIEKITQLLEEKFGDQE